MESVVCSVTSGSGHTVFVVRHAGGTDISNLDISVSCDALYSAKLVAFTEFQTPSATYSSSRTNIAPFSEELCCLYFSFKKLHHVFVVSEQWREDQSSPSHHHTVDTPHQKQ